MNKFESPRDNNEKKESIEKGKDVLIVARYIRHGERTKDGELLDIGREITKEKAKESKDEKKDFHAIKAYGSQAGPKNQEGMGRALETAHIYANEIAEGEAHKTRPLDVLSYENLVSFFPYDHRKIYDENLPDNFENLSDEEKIKATEKAQKVVFDHLVELDTPEAIAYKKEVAGAFAYDLLHLERMADKLKAGSRVLTPRGTHGGLMEFLLKEALIHKDNEGKEAVGIDNFDEIGGEFDPSDSFNVFIEKDEDGNTKEMKVTFDNPDRPDNEFLLDSSKVHELAEYYKDLHHDKSK